MDATRRAIKSERVMLTLDCNDEEIVVDAGPARHGGQHREGTVWIALYSRAVNVEIQKGENYGRTITYSNVVRHLVPAGRWEGEPASFHVSSPRREDIDGCAAFLQADKPSAIIGAAVMTAKTN
jgi:hypothetical protein